ncbi:hypothetical protein V8C44DRAFT_343878 [Trichoderma aethiopicum]
MSDATPQSMSLLDCFGIKNRKLASLQEELQKQDASKSYYDISNAIGNYLIRTPSIGANIPEPLKDQLTEILKFEKKGGALNTIELFKYAVKLHKSDNTRDYQSARIIPEVLCRTYPEMAFSVIDNKREKVTPLHLAAGEGAVGLVETMVEELLNYLRQQNPTLDHQAIKDKARREYLSKKDGNGKTAFLCAVEDLQFDVLKFFLQEYPALADMDSIKLVVQKTANDSKLGGASTDNGQDIRSSPLQAFQLLIQQIKTTQESEIWSSIWEEAVGSSSLEIIHYLLKDSGQEVVERLVTQHNAEVVMKKGSKQIWQSFDYKSRQELVGKPEEKKGLLHLAVEWRNADLVDEIIGEFPEQVEVQVQVDEIEVDSTLGKKRPENPQKPVELLYPMQFLAKEAKRNMDDMQTRKKIRDSLLHAMIRSTNEDFGIREIRRVLRLSQIDAGSICLQLPIDTDRDSFADYVQGLEDQGDSVSDTFKFEKVLKYVKCPSLHSYAQASIQPLGIAATLRTDYNEMEIMYNWLRKRGVCQVLDLSVPDRLFSPQSDEIVEKCVNSWNIRILNWRKLDLFLGRFTTKTKEHLRELHLYSSGNSSVHEQWYRELPTFPKLKRLFINVVTDILSVKRTEQVGKDLQMNLNGPKNIWKDGRCAERVRHIFVNEYSWEADVGRQTYRRAPEITNDVVGPDLGAFIRKYQAATSRKPGVIRTKVAVIDSGIMGVSGNNKKARQARPLVIGSGGRAPKANTAMPNGNPETENMNMSPERPNASDLMHCVADGRSFVNTGDEEEEVWWHASEPHGTQMARLICSVDPCCRLYVAKVAETRQRGLSPAVVAEAIRWAIRQEVDIISLSLVTYTDNGELSEAIMAAKKKDIVILCSTVDEGAITRPSTFNKSTHVNNNDVLEIAACNQYGRLLESSQSTYSYGFFGHKVHVGQIPFLQSDEHLSGSSVATAIAAGAASLILAFCRLSKYCKTGPGDDWRLRKVRDTFQQMVEDKNVKYVHLKNLCGKGKTLENMDFGATIDEVFR